MGGVTKGAVLPTERSMCWNWVWGWGRRGRMGWGVTHWVCGRGLVSRGSGRCLALPHPLE